MVRSTSSCLKIITCGSDSVDKDDLEQTESKGSTDKRGWSFRKRSARHRVLSNTVILDSPSTENKESPESTSIDFHAQTNPVVSEKISVSQWTDETPSLSTALNSKVPNPLIATEHACKSDPLISTEIHNKIDPLVITENASKSDPNLEESVAIIMQAAIRGYLAQRALLKLKNVIKLQAAVRGHLVRRQAVGTLRCVQAIVKMQALVRARHARMSLQRSVIEEKLDGKHERNSQSINPLGKENSGPKANRNYSSTEKLLSNGFARQLLESTPKKKPIHIKCDPSRPDSAWKWLERWVSVSSSSDCAQPQKPQFGPESQEQGKSIDIATSEIGTEIPTEVISEPLDLKSSIRETTLSLEGEENVITYDAGNFDFQACRSTSSSIRDDLQQPCLEDMSFSKAQETSSEIDNSQTEVLSDAAASERVPGSISHKPEADIEQPKRSVKRVASEQPETESKKFLFGSRKASNPAFVAAHSKFEELSSTPTSSRSISSTYLDVGVESKFDRLSSPVDSVSGTKELSVTESLISHEPRVPVGGSECGTELSISSTLDSPDRVEVGGDFKHDAEVMEKVTSEPNGTTINASNLENLDTEAKNISSASQANISYCSSIQSGNLEDAYGESVYSVGAVDSPGIEQQPTERRALDMQSQLNTVTDQKDYRSSPEGSPRSHITAPESHGTPSSQVSVKTKRNKLNKSGSTQNRKSQSAGKRSPSNPNSDSGARSSTEQLPKDPKNGTRRNSFGSARPDNVDQEPRDSSSNSIPNYMQATESARAKAYANNSPRSSPDMQDKDIYIKKRHSLPGANGKQGSPRMQRSMSQAQQGAKGNERKWQR